VLFRSEAKPHQEAVAQLDEATTSKLKALADSTDTTLYTCLLAAWALLLVSYSRRDDVVFGSTRSGRHTIADAEMVPGCFINTVPTSKYVLHADPNLPPMIREPFVCIQEDVLRRRNPTGIMSGARSCLDVALKDKGEATGGRRDRIQRLAEKKVITQSIADWAQTLWEEGNDATHDLTANLDRAIEHVEFLKLFFEVAYGLPARIEAAMTMESEQPMSNLAEESGNPTIESAA